MSELDHRTTGRIFDALEEISRHDRGVGLSDLARALKIPKGSLYPLLSTMARKGYLRYSETERRYTIGLGLFVLGRSYIVKNDLLDSISKEVRDLASAIEETVYFGVLSGGDMLYLIMSDAFTKIKVISSPGRKLPAYSTGCGKALLSQFSASQLRQLYPDGLKKVTKNTITSFEYLNRQLEEIRRTGFAFEEEESTQYIRCVGVSVCYKDRILAGLSIAVPVLRYSAEREDKIKRLLFEGKVAIENLIERNIDFWIYS